MDENDTSPPENLSALEDYAQSLIRRPLDPKRQQRIRLLIVSLIVLVAALSIVNLTKSDQFAALRGTGSIAGMVVDGNGHPIPAEVFIERSTIEGRSDSTGSFALSGVPVGQQLVVVAHNGMGQEYPVVVTAGGIANIGVIRVMKTAVTRP